MSAALMKLKFVRCPSVISPSIRVAIFSEPKCTDFFQILVVASPGLYSEAICLFIYFFFFLFFFFTKIHH